MPRTKKIKPVKDADAADAVAAEEQLIEQAVAPAAAAAAAAEEAEPCPICLSPYTAVRRKAISCPSCNKEFCVDCFKTYILTTTDDPHCVHCRHGFDRMFLQTNLSKMYMNTTYAEYRAKVLWKREESYLPAAQEKAERILRGRQYAQEVIAPIRQKHMEYAERIQKLRAKMNALDREIVGHTEIQNTLLRGELPPEEATVAANEPKERNKFTRKCTVEGCLGWLSSAWKCGLCQNYTCPECLVIKGTAHNAEHECKKEDLETANLIRSSSKPCPKCGEAIEKREGCDMMFCVSCHTPFSWKTMQIISRGSIHNPHYFEWRNRVGAGAGGAAHAAEPLPCGGMPTDAFIFRKNARKEYIFDEDMREELSNRYRITSHMENVTAPHYNAHTEIGNTEKYRIHYLLKEMTKEDVEQRLQADEKVRERHKAIRDVIDTYLVAAAEQLRIVAETPTVEVATTTIQQLDQLRDFINQCFRNVHKAYGCTVPVIEDTWSNVSSYTAAAERKHARQEALEAADPELVNYKEEAAELVKQTRVKRREMENIIRTLREQGNNGYYAYNNDPEYRRLQREVYEHENKYYTILGKITQRRNVLAAPVRATAAAAATEEPVRGFELPPLPHLPPLPRLPL